MQTFMAIGSCYHFAVKYCICAVPEVGGAFSAKAENTRLTFTASTFLSNSAKSTGGAVYAETKAKTFFLGGNNYFKGNNCENCGEGHRTANNIYNQYGATGKEYLNFDTCKKGTL